MIYFKSISGIIFAKNTFEIILIRSKRPFHCCWRKSLQQKHCQNKKIHTSQSEVWLLFLSFFAFMPGKQKYASDTSKHSRSTYHQLLCTVMKGPFFAVFKFLYSSDTYECFGFFTFITSNAKM